MASNCGEALLCSTWDHSIVIQIHWRPPFDPPSINDLFRNASPPHAVVSSSVQVKGGKRLNTCSLRPTGIYGEGDELIKNFYKQVVQRGGVIIHGVPKDIEHGRVYAGNSESSCESRVWIRQLTSFFSGFATLFHVVERQWNSLQY